jgi:hypothetical protein
VLGELPAGDGTEITTTNIGPAVVANGGMTTEQ